MPNASTFDRLGEAGSRRITTSGRFFKGISNNGLANTVVHRFLCADRPSFVSSGRAARAGRVAEAASGCRPFESGPAPLEGAGWANYSIRFRATKARCPHQGFLRRVPQSCARQRMQNPGPCCSKPFDPRPATHGSSPGPAARISSTVGDVPGFSGFQRGEDEMVAAKGGGGSNRAS